MSAFICNNYHISVLAHTACERKLSYRHNNKEKICQDPSLIGLLLYKENVRSFNYRYKESNPTSDFVFDNKAFKHEYIPAQLIAAIYCLDYQSCERPDWGKSEANAILIHLLAALTETFSEPGIWELKPLHTT